MAQQEETPIGMEPPPMFFSQEAVSAEVFGNP